LGVGKDYFLAPLGVEHDPGLLELGGVVREPAYLERLRRHEAMAARLVPGLDPIDRERNDVGLLGLRAERRPDGRQPAHPAARARPVGPTVRASASTSATGMSSPPRARSRRSPRSRAGPASRSPPGRSRPSCRALPWPRRST